MLPEQAFLVGYVVGSERLAHTEQFRAGRLAGQKSLESQQPLKLFLDECVYAAGNLTLFSDFYEAFQDWLSPDERGAWMSKAKIARHLPLKFPYGRHNNNKRYVGNLSLEPIIGSSNEIVVLSEGRLYVQAA
jgi:hypothetical protein